MIVDAHQHFWQIDRGVNDWIDDTISGIRRDYLPTHLAPYLTHFGIDKTILVQASETLLENDFMLDLAQQTDWIGGIVAWVDLSDPKAADQLQHLAKSPVIKGIRPVLQGIEDSDWILRPDVLNNVKLLPELGLCFDALIQPRHIKAIDQLAQIAPDLNIVIDHAAKPVIRAGQAASDDWFAGLQQLARHTNMHCKLSGLVTEFGPGWSPSALQPIADHLIETFTPARLMWGSDWPVLELDGSYPQWFTTVTNLITSCSADEQSDIMGGAAARFYSLIADQRNATC